MEELLCTWENSRTSTVFFQKLQKEKTSDQMGLDFAYQYTIALALDIYQKVQKSPQTTRITLQYWQKQRNPTSMRQQGPKLMEIFKVIKKKHFNYPYVNVVVFIRTSELFSPQPSRHFLFNTFVNCISLCNYCIIITSIEIMSCPKV